MIQDVQRHHSSGLPDPRLSPNTVAGQVDVHSRELPIPHAQKPLGEQLFIFGPDDLSPTKVEGKEHIRKQLAEAVKQAPAETVRDSQILGRMDDTDGQDGSQEKRDPESAVERCFNDSVYGTQPSESVLYDCGLLEPADYRRSAAESNRTIACADENTISPARVRMPQYPNGLITSGNDSSTMYGTGACMLRQVVDFEDKRILLNNLLGRSPSPAQPTAGFEHQSRSPCRDRQDSAAANAGVTARRPSDIVSEESLEVRAPNAQERRRFRAIKPYLIAGDISDLKLQALDSESATHDSFQAWLRRSDERKGTAIETLANPPNDNPRPRLAARRSGRAGVPRYSDSVVTAYIDIAQTISQKKQLGSRPYGVVPEYAIDRPIGLSRHEARSLFETEENQVVREPPRLARDPRHQPHLPGGVYRVFDVNRNA